MATPPHLDDPSRARKWPVAIATTLAAWCVAFGVVTALLTVFGDELATLPLALRALVISGVLVGLMVNLVMPVLNVAVARWARGVPRAPVAASARPGTSAVPEHSSSSAVTFARRHSSSW
jgi:antibiotic biosynthesis monooxygenase (ABM) superfamily enzyme